MAGRNSNARFRAPLTGVQTSVRRSHAGAGGVALGKIFTPWNTLAVIPRGKPTAEVLRGQALRHWLLLSPYLYRLRSACYPDLLHPWVFALSSARATCALRIGAQSSAY